MTDTPTGTPAGDESAARHRARRAGRPADRDQRDRRHRHAQAGQGPPRCCPLLVPVLSAIAVGVLAVNISRVFLAGDSHGGALHRHLRHVVDPGRREPAGRRAAHAHVVAGDGHRPHRRDRDGRRPAHAGPEPRATMRRRRRAPRPAGPAVGTARRRGARPSSSSTRRTTTCRRASSSVNYSGASGHTLAFREPNVLCVDSRTPGPPSEREGRAQGGRDLQHLLHDPRSRGCRHGGDGHRRRVVIGARVLARARRSCSSRRSSPGCSSWRAAVAAAETATRPTCSRRARPPRPSSISAKNFSFTPDTITADAGHRGDRADEHRRRCTPSCSTTASIPASSSRSRRARPTRRRST